jgi:hypothetical protein
LCREAVDRVGERHDLHRHGALAPTALVGVSMISSLRQAM